jgi:hypothetical protein
LFTCQNYRPISKQKAQWQFWRDRKTVAKIGPKDCRENSRSEGC